VQQCASRRERETKAQVLIPWEDAVKCFFDDHEAVGVCRFCGRATCKEHAEQRLPYIATIFVGANSTPKAVVVADAVWCGHCKPEAQPVPMPEIY
jgi:hypothetical protein